MLFLLITFSDGEGKNTNRHHNIPSMVPGPDFKKYTVCKIRVHVNAHSNARSYSYEFGEEIAVEQVKVDLYLRFDDPEHFADQIEGTSSDACVLIATTFP
jgi:hypothetical protein